MVQNGAKYTKNVAKTPSFEVLSNYMDTDALEPS